jgi:hypothetical protein
MSIESKSRPGQDPEREGPKLEWHDDERIQMYVSVGHDLVQHTPLGHQLECFRDNVRITGMPSTHPPGDWGYSTGTAYHRARETALRLWDTERAQPGAIATLWSYCHPTAVTMDGLPGGRGRAFALYPLTELGSSARRGTAPDAPRLIGPRPCDCSADRGASGNGCACWTRPMLLRRLYAESAESKGEQRAVWFQIHKQALARLSLAVVAWRDTRGAEDERRLQRKELRRAAVRARTITTATSDG